jgi:hypothetical protein
MQTNDKYESYQRLVIRPLASVWPLGILRIRLSLHVHTLLSLEISRDILSHTAPERGVGV